MQNLLWKIILIVLLLIGCVFAITPPDKKIRLGRDLSGGVSLIYSVRMDEGVDRQSVLSQTIEVLKERVNPDGVFDIQMTPLGTDRIEVVMPMPSSEVKELASVYRGFLDALLDGAQIRPGSLDLALAEGKSVEVFGGEGVRGILVSDLQRMYDELESSSAQLAQEPSNGALEQQVADAEIDFEDTREQLLSMSLDRNEVARLLQLSPLGDPLRDGAGRVLRDENTDEVLRGIAPRDVAFAELESGYPHLSEELGLLVDSFNEYQEKRTGFDDPEDLIRMLRGAGVLDFRIAVQIGKSEGLDILDLRSQLASVGPDNTDSPIAGWFPINNVEQWVETPVQLASLLANPQAYLASRSLEAAEYDGDVYLLLYNDDSRSMTHKNGSKWSVTSAYQTSDQFGRPAIAFRLDGAGGGKMGRMTGPHVNEAMAIVLDGQVYTAPNLNSQINGQGQITGSFSQSEIQYLLRTLAAGSLEARLSSDPIAVNIIGPSIGIDNLNRGMGALGWSIIAVMAFMLFYYMSAGLVADFALLANGLLIFGTMALIDGTFTLPGLAGVVLTMGMAVDANVLIYERIREEINAGAKDLRVAVREGYNKVYSTIIDANLTNLIVCFVLYRTATTEVKGFAVTLSIGIIATLFTSLFVTRVIFKIYTDVFGVRKLPMLPTVIPAVARILHPAVDWVSMRKLFWTLSFVVCGMSIFLLLDRGVTMLDTEFRGGVSMTMRTRVVEDERLLLAHTGEDSVESRVHAIGLAITGDSNKDQILAELAGATILTIGEGQVDANGRVVSNAFQIKVSNPPGIEDDAVVTKTVVEAITEAFGNDLDVPPALSFAGIGTTSFEKYTNQIPQNATTVGQILGTNARGDLSDYRGGVLLVVENIEPATSLEDIQKRIERMRQQPEYARDAGGREVEVFGVKRGAGDGYASIAVAVYDPDMNYFKNNPEVVDERVASNEWELVSNALSQPQSLDQVSSFSSQIAETMKANAIVAVILSLLGILAYIWFRFGSLRYSLAAIVALLHDVLVTLGALALAGYVANITFFSQSLKIEAFQIDLGVIAALLTVIGYSLNDTIVILDRIRENRGKRPLPTQEIVNDSINQTISRTVLTSLTTLIAVIIIYWTGGGGIRPFAFALLIGIFVGTYSSVAIAAPLVFKGHSAKKNELEL
ncbi:MAG TPA: protein translocase subunit SecD [Phycisphaerales bacterium]|nr:protein translocase subunit SecD [Phycisphaerales bacterium]HIB51442.1 protein translocase subunit SecD [Phycisphaerales bacterium]HIN83512.1 protein translocase subunit SecD [Phycisphaerales bacterium]